MLVLFLMIPRNPFFDCFPSDRPRRPFKSNAFETQLPLPPEQKQQSKSLEDQITVARYLDTLFPE